MILFAILSANKHMLYLSFLISRSKFINFKQKLAASSNNLSKEEAKTAL